MWSMVPRHNRIWWRRPLVFPLQVFIQWHHTHHHKEQHIHRQMITICHIHLQAMTLWWHRQPHTFMTQSKTRPKKSNKWRLYAKNVRICLLTSFIVVDETGVLFKYLNKIFPLFFIPDLHSVLIFLKTLFKFNLN